MRPGRCCFRASRPVRSLSGLFRRRLATSSSSSSRKYNDAIDLLNTLQTPHAVIQARVKAGIRPDASFMKEMRSCLARIGYSPEDLNRLNILHVAGTKGKGTTCAYTDSILSRCRLSRGVPSKVGLFTSPHLISVRERIRINSEPVSEELFARYFFEVWDRLEATTPPLNPSPDPNPLAETSKQQQQEDHTNPRYQRWTAGSYDGKPIYARYLTLMSWHLFLREGVDVAVYETGIGGEHDATNLVPAPCAVAITTLGVDHVFALGDTVDKIAWHKAGIMKSGRPAFTVPQVDHPSTERVLVARAAEKSASSLKFLATDPRLTKVRIRPDAEFQRRNATLAVALAEEALRTLGDPAALKNEEPPSDRKKPLPKEFVEGLEGVVWRGRCEVKEEEGVRWHVDGAHTLDSLQLAGRWFVDEVERGGRHAPRVLIFNQQGRPEATDFLAPFYRATRSADGKGFDEVIFCSNQTYSAAGYKRDFVNHAVDASEVDNLKVQRAFAEKWSQIDPTAKVSVVPSIEEAINRVRKLAATSSRGHGKGEQQVQALVTGSLHLVGGALGILEGSAETL